MPRKKHKKQTSKWKDLTLFFLDIGQSLIISLTIYILIYQFIAQPQHVLSISMLPNFVENDRVIAQKVSYRFSDPKRMDVVIFKFPENPDITLIKRVIGLPGEEIMISNNQVYINGIPLNETYILEAETSYAGSFLKENTPYQIQNDEYIVMGDNRAKSGDSRIWGTVPQKNIVGKVFFRYWPINRISVI